MKLWDLSWNLFSELIPKSYDLIISSDGHYSNINCGLIAGAYVHIKVTFLSVV